MRLVYAAIAFLFCFFSGFVFAEVNDSNNNFELRGSLGAGKLFWGYVSHGNSSADLGTGPTALIGLAAKYSWRFVGIEGDFHSGSISDLKWEDKDSSNVNHKYKSSGSGYYTVFDLKLGAQLFTEPGDAGYTYIYAGKRFWTTERTEDSLTMDGVSYNAGSVKRKANGDGWIAGFRDFSTFGYNDSFAIVFQSGLFFGKAPVKTFKQNGVEITQPNDSSFSLGGELAGGVSFQNIGLSVVGGFRGEINATSFKDTAAPTDEESVFGFGHLVFFVEASMQF